MAPYRKGMSSFGNTGPDPPGIQQAPPVAHAPPGPPKVDMMASAEMQAWLDRLKVEDRQIGTRNVYLAWALAAGVLLLLVVLGVVYRGTIGAYAVIDDDQIQIEQHAVNQGRLLIKFNVVSPGKVYCRRTSGHVETDVIDTFRSPGPVERPWSWVYQPGEDIQVTLWYRRGLFRRAHVQSFPTAGRADIVILMDTTGSMSPSIAELKEKCVTFSKQLEKQALEHRFALIGFGDANQRPWLDKHDFTSDVTRLRTSVSQLERFDGGDFPESALDALEVGLSLPFDENAIRRFYLVTDAEYHEPTRSGATAEEIAARLGQQRVLLRVFSRPQFEADYARLLADTGRFQEVENFGKVLSEGRILED